MTKDGGPPAFAGEGRAQATRAAVKAAWWGAAAAAARRAARFPAAPAPSEPELAAPPPPEGFVRRAWSEAFEKDAAAVARGLYPPMEVDARPLRGVARAIDMIVDARSVERRRRGEAVDPVPDLGEKSDAYPTYYRQNFHFQSGGWLTAASARRYEAQVETLFAGAAGAMRRRALALIAQAWRTRDHRGLQILDLACGSGAFLEDLGRAFPRARRIGIDLSGAYLAEAAARGAGAVLAQAKAEALPLASDSLDAVSCVFLFHELPPKVRRLVAAEIARVLKPGGFLAFADALQPADEPRLARLLEAFPAYFHEPFFASYGRTDLLALFAEAGLTQVGEDHAFLTKARLYVA